MKNIGIITGVSEAKRIEAYICMCVCVFVCVYMCVCVCVYTHQQGSHCPTCRSLCPQGTASLVGRGPEPPI